MKKILLLLTTILLLTSCQDVVDIPLENAPAKLVIDANIKWYKGTDGATQVIKLSLTNDFYTSEILPASGAIVSIKDDANTLFNFIEDANTGNYICTNFVPQINTNYTLTVVYKGETYTATSKLLATPVIQDIQQETKPGISGEDEIQVKFFFQDDGQQENYYLLKVKNPEIVFPEYGVVSDEFFQGNLMFGFYNDDIKKGNLLQLSVQGIDKAYFNYMSKLISASGGNSGNPFATPPAVLRGNIINVTNSQNFPFGYFALGEVDARDYTVQ
ncbi:DUF4249 domain-containing protein [Flavobacterium luminosum]|uniref:DUF4249 domain-containing protein n=1 Tax=Flavobacterium luminosum TaxID=2949086 RepID=A0ABT0TLS4_9FLAO|nr:DUF4249 domain-containing protein [Flavobacterium sp. HXWNR70]MCL9808449.1 DUF4249 domain-containing protein [Flavobacterium sp. HXWNR70]